MRVKLKRPMFVDGVYYDTRPEGVVVPDNTKLPRDALVWDGKEFVEVPEKEAELKRIATAGKKTSPDFDPDNPTPPPPIYNPAYKVLEQPEVPPEPKAMPMAKKN